MNLSRNKVTSKYFKGVFPADKLPTKIKKPALIIANTDPSNKPGRHWVAFYLPKVGPPEYFDSVGFPPQQEEFLKFLKNHGKAFKYNQKRLQGSLSTTCGNYCGVYLYYRVKQISFSDFLKLFSSKDFARNDKKIEEMYNKIFNKNNSNQVGGNQIICNQVCQPCEF